MDASLLPVSLPARGSIVARTAARVAPLVLLAGLAVALIGRSAGLGTTPAPGISEAISLNVGALAAGRLATLAVHVGQPVRAGDVIATLDPRPLEIERQRVAAEQALLEAKLAAEMSREDDAVMRAEVWRLRTVAGAEQDRAALSVLDRQVVRLDGLLGDKLVKASDVEPYRRERDALAARLGTFARARAAGQAGLDDKPRGGKAAPHDDVVRLRTAPLRQALEVNKAALAAVDLGLAGLTLRAPADGQVSVILRRPGEVVAAAEPVAVIVAHRPGVFEAFVSARERRTLEVGMSATVSRSSLLSRGVTVRVIEVSPTVTELPLQLRSSPQVPVWGRRIVLDGSDSAALRAIPAGEQVRVRL